MPARKPTTAAKKMVTQEVEAPAPAPQLQAGHWLQVRLPQTVGRWPAASAKARTPSAMSPCQKGETSMNERAGPNKSSSNGNLTEQVSAAALTIRGKCVFKNSNPDILCMS